MGGLAEIIRAAISRPGFWDMPPRRKREVSSPRARRFWEHTGGRVMFERGQSSGGFHETVFRFGRWVLCFTHDTKHWGGSRHYSAHLRRAPKS